jgi:hypothetical protein
MRRRELAFVLTSNSLVHEFDPDTALRRYIVWQREGSYFRSLDLIARELENLMWYRA